MKLVRKLQLAFLSLMLGPVLLIGTLFLVTYFVGGHSLGPHPELDGPGFIKTELSLIMKEDWDRYSELRERIVIFVLSEDGTMLFPRVTDGGIFPKDHPFASDIEGLQVFQPGTQVPGRPGRSTPVSLIDVFDRYGTEWSYGMYFTPFTLNGERYTAGWQEPTAGLGGFMARRGWVFPLVIFTGMMIIPAFIDAKLRRSIQRLQSATVRFKTGNYDEPISIRKNDDLIELAESLEAVRIELKKTRDQGVRFLMAVSHDLRTPLTSIKGYIEALGDGMAETQEDFERYLAVLAEKAALLENRIGELIDFARVATGGMIGKRSSVDAADLFFRLDAAFRTEAGFAGWMYASELAVPSGVVVDGNAESLYRAWENLFVNAIRHTDEGRFIRFRVGMEGSEGSPPVRKTKVPVSEPGTFLFGEIEDDGEGVDEAFVPQLFEIFARADKGRNREGLGLGLASVRFIVEAHRGTADYRPAPGGGSIFRIRIPCRLPG